MPYFALHLKMLWPVVSAHGNSGMTQAFSSLLLITSFITFVMEYSCLTPLLIPIEPNGRPLPAYEKMDMSEERRHKPEFGGLPRGVPYDPIHLSFLALPDALMEMIANSSNA